MNDLRDLGARMVKNQDEALAGLQARARIRSRLIRTVTAGRGGREARAPSRWLRLGLATAAAGGLAAVVFLHLARQQQTIAFVVGSSQSAGDVGGWISAPVDSTLPLRFSDGTAVILEPSASARVDELHSDGARVVLESGRLRAAVVRRPKARWHLKAGPFDVQVTGTRFDLQWSPRDGKLMLSMEQGSVIVSGGSLPSPRSISAGEVLTATLSGRRWQIASAAEAASASVAAAPAAIQPAPSPSIEPEAADKPTSSSALVPQLKAPPSSWRALLHNGGYREALAQLDEEEFRRACRSERADELLALGDAARLGGEPSRARAALQAVRRRFPGDARASIAAFTLGRVAFEHSHSYDESARWFARYLVEEPRGPLAREAAGRLLEARRLAGDGDGARTAAQQYLRSYPSGPHADLAKRELGAP